MSWEVLKSDRELMVLPVISFLAIAVVAGILFAGAVGIGLPKNGQQPTAAHYALLAVMYLAGSFISIFFNAAMIGAATIRLKGGDPTVRDGLRLAWARVGKIFVWAAVAATVGLILRIIEERVGWFGRLIVSLLGAAWAAVTFFVVPVLLYEDLRTLESVKRSAGLFKQRWGEQFTGNVAIGLVLILVAIPVVGVALALGAVALPVGIIVGVLALALLAAVGASLSGIFHAALYQYATTGQAVGGFSDVDLRGAFRHRRRSRGLGGFGGEPS